MKLFIHIGIYKAGSSYLQYVCSNLRDDLKLSHSIYFPNSREDFKMISGEISKGNADGLEKALNSKNLSATQSRLKTWFDESQKANCDSVLLSAESLVHQIADKEKKNLLVQAARASGFEEIHVMGFFRDLVDHAISTFKHRGKRGRIQNFEHWLENEYETPKLLKSLAETRHADNDIFWTFRKFQKDGQILNQAFFVNWLKISDFHFDGRPSVNESVTLSEIQMLQILTKKYSDVIDSFVNAFKVLPKTFKANDNNLELKYAFDAFTVLSKRFNEWNLLNSFLEDDEKLQLYSGSYNLALSDSVNSTLSHYQLNIVIDTIHYWNRPVSKLLRFKRRLVKIIPKSFRHLILKKS